MRPAIRTRRLVTVLLAVLAAYFLMPLYWLVVAATKSTGDLINSSPLWFANPQLFTNLGELFSFGGGIFWRWVLNSVVYAGVGALGATLISACAGYALAKCAFRGREALFNVILAGVLLPMTALGLPLFLLMSKLGLANTYWAVLLPSLVSPFGVYLSRVYAATVPDDVLDAARSDGAGEWRIFAKIVLRIMSPALVTIFLFQFVAIWNNYFLPLVMLSDNQLYPITLGLTSWQGFADRQPILQTLTVVGALVSVIPLIVLSGALQRFWRAGLTEGSVRE
ncbi:carbohydrate ABC transporter permease [Nonomuraea rubra]|uniref:Multiple sugar transport system permease protein n=1 Tax=Nonomuraea rubra TaxID=46180 RepID=A0A7X0NSK4_9ACTN|nr:carbohydrate ABC transporter permease [Nonomuraea rubra]MBB6548859.1 multiple sugar transport system permease protein [Nonomuraea rubra]